MKKYKVAVIGDVGAGEPVFNGQTAKTRDYIFFLQQKYGDSAVCFVDTRYWKKKIVKKTLLLIKAMIQSDYLLLSLGANGRKLILPFVLSLKGLFGNKVLFSVVGGSLMYEYESEPKTVKCMKKTTANFVETIKFKNFLEGKGIPSIYYSPVFSKRKGIEDLGICIPAQAVPYRFCTYSRVCREKGTSAAIDAIVDINRKYNKKICELDIYGYPQPDYEIEFNEKVSNAADCVHVYPYLDDTNAIQCLSEHYMMLFPTYYPGEGFPIAIIECLKSAVPVIASDWHFNSEVVIDGETGLIFDLADNDGLKKCIEWAIQNPDDIAKMKKQCLDRAKMFEPENALGCLFKIVDGCD